MLRWTRPSTAARRASVLEGPAHRLGEVRGLLVEHVNERRRIEVEQVAQEVVGKLGLDAVGQDREVSDVRGDDYLGAGFQRRRGDMSILGIVLHCIDERLVTSDVGFGKVPLHRVPQTRRLFRRHAWCAWCAWCVEGAACSRVA